MCSVSACRLVGAVALTLSSLPLGACSSSQLGTSGSLDAPVPGGGSSHRGEPARPRHAGLSDPRLHTHSPRLGAHVGAADLHGAHRLARARRHRAPHGRSPRLTPHIHVGLDPGCPGRPGAVDPGTEPLSVDLFGATGDRRPLTGLRTRLYMSIVRKTPAATADPTTPAMFGPMAGISGFTRPSVSWATNC